jgi:hypothetical protein
MWKEKRVATNGYPRVRTSIGIKPGPETVREKSLSPVAQIVRLLRLFAA